MKLIKKSIYELLGTMFLIFFACGTAITSATYGLLGSSSVNIVATSLSFGLILMALIYLIGDESGCHLNPAVSLAAFINRKMSLKECIFYILSQLVGAILGAAILYAVLKATGNGDLLNRIDATNFVSGEGWKGYVGTIIFEVMATFIFVLVILKVTENRESKKLVGIVVGLTLTVVHLIGLTITGTSVNPARSFGPALMSSAFKLQQQAIKDVWVFFVGPLLGGLLAGFVHKLCSRRGNNRQ